MSSRLVIIPTYNERDNIENMIRCIFSLSVSFDILIVDDSSPDGTSEIIKLLQEEFPEKLHLEERSRKNGLGQAYIHGFKWALSQNYEYIFEMDADFSHNPEDLIRLYNECRDKYIDIAIGSRYIKGVNVVNWPMSRVLMSYFASFYCRLITRVNIMDYTAGFVCYKQRAIKIIDLDKIRFSGYAFQIEMKFTAAMYGLRIKEIPIIFTERVCGESKMSTGIFREAFLGVLTMKIRSLFRKYNFK